MSRKRALTFDGEGQAENEIGEIGVRDAAPLQHGEGDDDLDGMPGQLLDIVAELVDAAEGALESQVHLAERAAMAGNDDVDG